MMISIAHGKQLTRRERLRREMMIRILRAEGKTLAKIGKQLGVSRQAVHDFLKRMEALPGRKPQEGVVKVPTNRRPTLEEWLQEIRNND